MVTKRYITFISLLSLGCDVVEVAEKDLKKYPEIAPFTTNCKNFRGSHDLDLGVLNFSCQTDLVTIDSVADKHNWIIKRLSDSRRMYLKEIKDFPADVGIDTLFVEFDQEEDRLLFQLIPSLK